MPIGPNQKTILRQERHQQDNLKLTQANQEGRREEKGRRESKKVQR